MAAPATPERHLAAVLAADIVGYAGLMHTDEVATLTALRAFRHEVFEPLVAEHAGTVVKRMGDGWLVTFTRAGAAVACATAVQDRLADHAMLKLRIGIHVGDVTHADDDIYGDGVNIAARLEALATPGTVVISETAHRTLGAGRAAAFTGLGPQSLKNIATPVVAFTWGETAATATAAADAPPSIAVLPFANHSGDTEQEYFADGITDDIITALSQIPGLFVISRNSAFTYKGKVARPEDISRDLGVRTLLEGSVRKAGARIRVTAQLIDGTSGGHLWAERYDRDLADIFAVQDDVTAKIVAALSVKLVAPSKATDHATHAPASLETENLEAYDCVLRGREQYRTFTAEGFAAAGTLYRRAIDLDPGYAAAHAGLAEVLSHEYQTGQPTRDQAVASAEHAATLDPDHPLVCEALTQARLFSKDHDGALAAAHHWIEIEPGNAEAYATLAMINHFAGAPEDVIALVAKATHLNPHYPFYYDLYIGMAYFSLHRYEQAIPALKDARAANPDTPPPHIFLAACYGHLGDTDAAATALAEARRRVPNINLAGLFEFLPYRHHADSRHLVAGLRKAGLSG